MLRLYPGVESVARVLDFFHQPGGLDDQNTVGTGGVGQRQTLGLGLVGDFSAAGLNIAGQSGQTLRLLGQRRLVQRAQRQRELRNGLQEGRVPVQEVAVQVVVLRLPPLVETPRQRGQLVKGPLQCIQYCVVPLEGEVPRWRRSSRRGL